LKKGDLVEGGAPSVAEKKGKKFPKGTRGKRIAGV